MIRDPLELCNAIDALLDLPRHSQPAEALALAGRIDLGLPDEIWNTRFGPDTLFEAWTQTEVVQGLYAANRAVLQDHLRPGWQAIEIGGGDGRLWESMEAPTPGTLVMVDPVAEVHEVVHDRLPSGVELDGRVALIQDELSQLPEADAIVCSLTLHHVAGRDAAERSAHGLAGMGKFEVLEAFARLLRPRGGVLVLNEADVYCDLGLASGDPFLADRLTDSYIRRCAHALVGEIRRGLGDPTRVAALIQRWSLQQIALADVPVAERDVYELDVPRWLALLDDVGFEIVARGFTDEVRLFHQYVARPR